MQNKNRIRIRKIENIESVFDGIGLLIMAALFLSYIPKDVYMPFPATGGDTGSHFWPVYTLKNFGLPEFTVKLWNAGNLGGEPHLVHYFPLPFILMALMGFVIPLETAFNIGTLLPLLMLPTCAYTCFRLMGFRFPAPILASVFLLPSIYNEAFSMWGGNTLSTLAGQFAHVYAFCFLFLALGFTVHGLKRNKMSFWGLIFLSAVALSHAYVFLIVPVFFASAFFLVKKEQIKPWLKILTLTGVMTLLLSLWFIYPMIDNNKWTTPLPMSWGYLGIWKSFTAPIYYPLYVIFVCWFLIQLFPRMRWNLKQNLKQIGFWGIPILTYAGLFFVFPKIGLVDARAIPQIQLFFSVVVGIMTGMVVSKVAKRLGSLVVTLPLLVLMVWWTSGHVHNFPNWCKWNYSSWNKKYLYPKLQSLVGQLEPGLEKPRIVFEHNDISNGAGTIRVFEMLPYFARRATLESLYTQASILSPEAFYLQAKVSKTPSCPFRDFKCPKRGFDTLEEKFDLMGVDHLIGITKKTNDSANRASYISMVGEHSPWTLYRVHQSPRMAVPLLGQVEIIENDSKWQQKFYSWFDEYNRETSKWLIVNQGSGVHSFKKQVEENRVSNCRAQIETDFFGFTLKTDCKGTPHLVKYAYHDALIPDSGDPTYLVSPGMIGVTPSSEKVRFQFGRKISWIFSGYVSLFSFVFLVGVSWRKPKWWLG